MQTSKKAALAAIGLLAMTPLALAENKPYLALVAKPTTLTPWVAPNKVRWRLPDILAKHKGQARWDEPVVRDGDFMGDYIQQAAGDKQQTRFYSDNRVLFVVWDGQIQFTIEGQKPFVATKGFLVEVPFRVPFSTETVGGKPSLHFEVRSSQDQPLYPVDGNPVPKPGITYVKVSTIGKGSYDDRNKPVLDFEKDVVHGDGKGLAFIASDHFSADVIRGPAVPTPPPSNRGHFHVDFAEFWFILEGNMDYLIEGTPFFTADAGDIVYVPRGHWHRASFGGPVGQMDTRFAINPFPQSMNNYATDAGAKQ
jgi:mannose-6-phosphate isomerase-like protein (cupin superfamily)